MMDTDTTPIAAEAWDAEIRTLEERARVAFLAADVETLDALWADEFVVNSPLNVINDKPRVIELLRAGRIRHDTYDVTIERIARFGDVVVVMGSDAVDGPPHGVRMERRFTNVWQLQGGRWRSIARHAQIVAPGAPPVARA